MKMTPTLLFRGGPSAPTRGLPWRLLSVLSALLPIAGWAQAPTVSALLPARNALAAPRTTAVQVGFNQALSNSAATLGALHVFSQQAGGKKAGSTTVSGSTLTFTPRAPFQAGETVQATVTAAAQSSMGGAVSPQVFQFTTATLPSTPEFTGGAEVNVGGLPEAVVVGDVDGDGDLDLDLVTVNAAYPNIGTVSVRLNSGAGRYSGGSQFSSTAIGGFGGLLTLGDLDGDGDLDLLVSSALNSSGIVDVRRNDGSGNFSSSQPFTIYSGAAQVNKMQLGDLDADGDLDLVAMLPIQGVVSLRLNDGNGIFSGGQNLRLGSTETPFTTSLGDVDSDGDLDVVATMRWSDNSGQNRVLPFERHERQSPTYQTPTL